MNPFEVYCEYLSLKQHFTSKNYDYHKYAGKVSAKVDTFETRRDKYAFVKLSKHRDPQGFLIANFVDGRTTYVMDMMNGSGEVIYLKWLKRKQAITQTFKQDLNQLGDKFLPTLAVTNGQPPTLLRLYGRRKVSIETMIIIDDITDCFRFWNGRIVDPVYWPEVYQKCVKYRSFLDYDKNKFKKLLIEHFV